MFQKAKNWAKKIQEEWKILEENLPGKNLSILKRYSFIIVHLQDNVAVVAFP